jgi:HPt (histidine-containing phosphotransfer) domain-containing protein
MASSKPIRVSPESPARPIVHQQRRPLDLAHLYQQTMGNRALQLEILDMFCKQINSTIAAFAKADASERRRLAHALKGTGRSVGAFVLADIAEQIEKSPLDRAIVAKLNDMAVRTCDYAASVNR